MTGIEGTKSIVRTRECGSIFRPEINSGSREYIARHDVAASYKCPCQIASACLKRFSTGREGPIDNGRYRSSAQSLVAPITVFVEIRDFESKITIRSCIPGESIGEYELNRFSDSEHTPVRIIFAISESRFWQNCTCGSYLVELSRPIHECTARSLYARITPRHGKKRFTKGCICSIVGDVSILHSLDISRKWYDFLEEIDSDYYYDHRHKNPDNEGRSFFRQM